jgi:hypothetical protein
MSGGRPAGPPIACPFRKTLYVALHFSRLGVEHSDQDTVYPRLWRPDVLLVPPVRVIDQNHLPGRFFTSQTVRIPVPPKSDWRATKAPKIRL